ncbi:MAG: NADH-quinone oxidoreductase subunit N [Kiritimatiellia bacterium]
MNYLLFAPELALIVGSLVVFAISLGTNRGRLAALATALTAMVNLGLCLASLSGSGTLFYQAYRVDLFSQLFKCFIALGLLAVVLFGGRLKDIRESIRPEFFFFLILGTLGLTMLVSSVELITLFVALELSSYALYLLVPLRKERPGMRVQMESAAKYVMFGVVSTGFLLFGMSYLYGLTGSTYFHEIAPALALKWHEPAALAAMVLVLAGLLFKLAAFPMHLWAPDVYQGASNETTAFIAGVPKVGVIAVLIRFLLCANPAQALPSSELLCLVLSVVAIGSMFFGNLAALVQKDIKRMLGYSSIAHAGYVLLGLVTLRAAGYATAMFYIFGFLAMSLVAFLVICQMSKDGENVLVEDLSGLHKRNPMAAFLLAASMFGMAGIPPFVGFIGKFLLLSEALRNGFMLLVVIAALNTAIGIYYYLNIVRVMYMATPENRPDVRLDRGVAILGVALIVLVTLLGLMPGPLLQAATQATAQMVPGP